MASTDPQAIVDAIDAAILDHATNKGIRSNYSINGRNLQHFSLSELRSLRDYYSRLVANAQAARNFARLGRER